MSASKKTTEAIVSKVRTKRSRGGATQAASANKVLLAKARVAAGSEIDEQTALQAIDNTEEIWTREGAVIPPYDPESLLNYVELSAHITPNLDSYAQNIEGYGYQPVPAEVWMSDLDGVDARETIRNAIEVERWLDAQSAAEGEAQDAEGNTLEEGPDAGDPSLSQFEDPGDVSEADIDDAIKRLKSIIRREEFIFDSWFENCCSEMSFVKLRRQVRWDIEAAGWGAIEFIPDEWGNLRRLGYIPGYTVRPLVDEGKSVEVVERNNITPLSEGREVRIMRKFRRYVQIVGSQRVFFKSPGDPRVVSRFSGKIYADDDELQKAEGKKDKPAEQAHELLYLPLHSPRTPCPPPRWIGNLLAVLGSRSSDEVNYLYFDNKSIPPGILFVAGGRLPRETRQRLETKIAAEIHGVENFHKILVVEALPAKVGQQPGDRGVVPTMKWQSLRDAQQSDALFTKYDQNNADKIGASFRLPPMLRGYTPRELNRATALASLQFAEQQVFQPERQDVDWMINKHIIPRIGIDFLRIRSNSPPTRDAEELAEVIKAAGPLGGLVPTEIRQLLSDLFNMPMERIDDAWAKQPMPMTLAGMVSGESSGGGQSESNPETAEVMARLELAEQRIANIVTEELRLAGMDVSASASFLDPPPGLEDAARSRADGADVAGKVSDDHEEG